MEARSSSSFSSTSVFDKVKAVNSSLKVSLEANFRSVGTGYLDRFIQKMLLGYERNSIEIDVANYDVFVYQQTLVLNNDGVIVY